jgi:hypothetical protein
MPTGLCVANTTCVPVSLPLPASAKQKISTGRCIRHVTKDTFDLFANRLQTMRHRQRSRLQTGCQASRQAAYTHSHDATMPNCQKKIFKSDDGRGVSAESEVRHAWEGVSAQVASAAKAGLKNSDEARRNIGPADPLQATTSMPPGTRSPAGGQLSRIRSTTDYG